MGRQIINTGGPARTRYNAIRAAVTAIIIIVCIAVIVFYVHGRQAHQHVTAPNVHPRAAGKLRHAAATYP
ncbi:MAG: hypothetical protein GIX03_14565 [Candidatus Eremiobacteraeota bacterium]|nr:hypothetical protein [Candidatus Eremiobacteraeota bacterium]MBC5804189.1 hypothetical protein [Candidatus Eremiobacteraeota bacterium]MBC5822611.1 hypothetical protein [Candidatus Eremiobacteraeota bacterium]